MLISADYKIPEIEEYQPTEEDWREYDAYCQEQQRRQEAEEFLAWVEYLGFLQDLVESIPDCA